MFQNAYQESEPLLKKKNELNHILSFYSPECRYLKSIDVEGDRGIGQFCITSEPYVKVDSTHLNAVSSLICYNQLALAFYGEYLKTIDLEQEINDETVKKIYILKHTGSYRKVINPILFTGIIVHQTLKNRNNLLLVTNTYDFGESAFYGEMLLAVDLR